MVTELAHENIWFDKWRYADAERQFYEKKSGIKEDMVAEMCSDIHESGPDESSTVGEPKIVAENLKSLVSSTPHIKQREDLEKEVVSGSGLGSLASQIAKARQEIQNSLTGGRNNAANSVACPDLFNRVIKLEDENLSLHKIVSSMEETISALAKRLSALECGSKTTTRATSPVKMHAKPVQEEEEEEEAEEEDEDDDDDDVDLFGSDEEEEDEEAARVREERIQAYADKKTKKPGPIAKSSVLLDCKPWDDETDMKDMETEIRKIAMDGLVWGAAKLVPLAYGIQKLSILCTVVDEKVSIDDLTEQITELEDYVQSVDIGAFNKV